MGEYAEESEKALSAAVWEDGGDSANTRWVGRGIGAG